MSHRSITTVVLVAVCCALPPAVLAEPPSGETARAEFRQGVVDRWNWRPNRGIALTTTEYARDYLTRYTERLRELRSTPAFNPSSALVVLFQTDLHDIIVTRPGDLHPDVVVIFHRHSGDPVLSNASMWPPRYNGEFRFEQWNGEGPPELVVGESASGGTGFVHASFAIHDLSSPTLDALFSTGATYDDQSCPGVITIENNVHAPERIEIQGREGLLFRRKLAFAKKGLSHHCDWSRERATVVENRCRYEAKTDDFTCERTVTRSWRIDELGEAGGRQGNWKVNAANLQWVMANHERLRRAGFEISDPFLDRLPRHLPAPQRAKYRRMIAPD